MVDSWLEWTESEVETRTGAGLRELLKNVLEPYLANRVYLCADVLTVADISLFVSLYGHFSANGINMRMSQSQK